MSTKMTLTVARLDEPAAMADFLGLIPNGGQLEKVLAGRKVVASRAYDDDTWTARFVASDGQIVKCFSVGEITIDQAEMIAVLCVDIQAWGEAEFDDVVRQALGPTFDPG